MDNITHSLVGVAIADVMARRTTKSRRPLLVGTGVVAANLPDIDIAYSVITPAPLGYLLHHRGHTHTVVGLCALAVALALIYQLIPPVRAMRGADRLRFYLLISLALASHLAMDAVNWYGVHPFYPFDNRWRYGDAVFVFEPALWVVLGVAVAWNGRSRTSRLAAAVPLILLLIAVATIDVMPFESAVVLTAGGAAFAWFARKMSPRGRAAVALAASLLIVVALIGTSRGARAAAIAALQPSLHGRLVDVALTPQPASPLCWSVIGVELVRPGDEYVLWRGTLSLAAMLKPPESCALHRLEGVRQTRTLGGGSLALRDRIRQSSRALRELADRDCWARAWLRFGRVPVVQHERLFDLRFADRRAQEFSHLSLVRDSDTLRCPPWIPRWEMPRNEVLSGAVAGAVSQNSSR
jgi:inner membrane protein